MLRFLRPDVFVSVLDADVADFKESAKRFLDRADARGGDGGQTGKKLCGRAFRRG